MVSSNRVGQNHEALVMWILYADKTFKGACYECSKSLSCGKKKERDMSILYAIKICLD